MHMLLILDQTNFYKVRNIKFKNHVFLYTIKILYTCFTIKLGDPVYSKNLLNRNFSSFKKCFKHKKTFANSIKIILSDCKNSMLQIL